MDELLNRLRIVLVAENKAQNALKEIKSDKDAILEELNGMIKADNYANDFVTLRKKPRIRVLDEQIAVDFMKDVKQIDKQKVEDYFYAGREVPGVDVEIKLVAYKKRNGLL